MNDRFHSCGKDQKKGWKKDDLLLHSSTIHRSFPRRVGEHHLYHPPFEFGQHIITYTSESKANFLPWWDNKFQFYFYCAPPDCYCKHGKHKQTWKCCKSNPDISENKELNYLVWWFLICLSIMAFAPSL